ncbi:hypothetical protein U1Q18_007040, partial [Sarracenia purpurea var. burkii]
TFELGMRATTIDGRASTGDREGQAMVIKLFVLRNDGESKIDGERDLSSAKLIDARTNFERHTKHLPSLEMRVKHLKASTRVVVSGERDLSRGVFDHLWSMRVNLDREGQAMVIKLFVLRNDGESKVDGERDLSSAKLIDARTNFERHMKHLPSLVNFGETFIITILPECRALPVHSMQLATVC